MMQTLQTLWVGRRLALFAACAVVVGVVALVVALSTGPPNTLTPLSPQDAVARIPVSTATPYPFATTSTPWRIGDAANR